MTFQLKGAVHCYNAKKVVGVYIAGTSSSKLTVTFIDMNGGNKSYDPSTQKTDLFGKFDLKTCKLSDNTCTSYRDGAFGKYLDGAKFIFTDTGREWSWGTGTVPSVPTECKA